MLRREKGLTFRQQEYKDKLSLTVASAIWTSTYQVRPVPDETGVLGLAEIQNSQAVSWDPPEYCTPDRVDLRTGRQRRRQLDLDLIAPKPNLVARVAVLEPTLAAGLPGYLWTLSASDEDPWSRWKRPDYRLPRRLWADLDLRRQAADCQTEIIGRD